MITRKHNFIAIFLCASAFQFELNVARTDEETTPSPHIEFFKALEGVWDYKIDFPGGEVGVAPTGVVNWARRAHGHTLRGYWRTDDGTGSTELLGYRKSDGLLLSNGYGELGEHWNLELSEVTATSIAGRCKGTHPNGVSFEGAFKGTIHGNTYTFSVKGKTESGEPHAFSGKCQRRIQVIAETGEAARCPWTWMLGEWKVKRSDDTTALVTWQHPAEEADVLTGKWTESDGNVLTELVGWQPDRKRLVANAYGVDGVFFTVVFNEVKTNSMSGWYRNRDAAGKISNGTVEIKRTSETEVRSKLVDNDGTVLTEVFTKIQ
jgi:hypothetical protein